MERAVVSQYGGAGKSLCGPYGDERKPARIVVGSGVGFGLTAQALQQSTSIISNLKQINLEKK
jgi:hypothetical protein